LESREEVLLGPDGVAEDRRFYVVDAEGRLVDQLTAGSMVQVAAWTDPDATILRMTFPDGIVVEEVVRLGDAVEQAHAPILVGPDAEIKGDVTTLEDFSVIAKLKEQEEA